MSRQFDKRLEEALNDDNLTDFENIFEEKEFDYEDDDWILRYAIKVGAHKILDYIIENTDWYFLAADVLEAAYESGGIELIKRLIDNGTLCN